MYPYYYIILRFDLSCRNLGGFSTSSRRFTWNRFQNGATVGDTCIVTSERKHIKLLLMTALWRFVKGAVTKVINWGGIRVGSARVDLWINVELQRWQRHRYVTRRPDWYLHRQLFATTFISLAESPLTLFICGLYKGLRCVTLNRVSIASNNLAFKFVSVFWLCMRRTNEFCTLCGSLHRKVRAAIRYLNLYRYEIK